VIKLPYEKRKEIYKKIEEERERPLISYITSIRQNAQGQMAPDVIPEFTEQLREIPDEKNEIDLLIVSLGGDPTTSWRLISLMREKFDKVDVLLPYVAYSAATLVALGADEIYMHPFSNLGPVDPQLRSDESGQFSSEDLRHYIDFLKEEVGISDQEQMEKAFEFICEDIGAKNIGTAQRSAQLSISMGEKLLKTHMEDKTKVNAISESLNKSFYHHGYPVGRSEAKEIGLPIKDPSEKIKDYLWTIWKDISKDMKCREPFDPLSKIYENQDVVEELEDIPTVQLPANFQNLDPQIKQQIINNIANNIVSIKNIPPVELKLFQATLESIRIRSKFEVEGKIYSCRNPDMTFSVNLIHTDKGWKRVKEEE